MAKPVIHTLVYRLLLFSPAKEGTLKMSPPKNSPTSTSQGEQKFRPYFSASELTYIIRTLKSVPAPAIGLIRYLEGFAIKIERGIIAPQLELKETLESRLGLSGSLKNEDKLENQVTLWESYPESRTKFTAPALEKIAAFRWENGRMSAEEEAEYEKSLGM